MSHEVLLFPPPGPWRLVLPEGVLDKDPAPGDAGHVGLLTMAEAAERMNISVSLLKRLIYEQALDSVSIGRARRIPARAIAEFLASQSREA
jgi:excisionase family DNA binding protein